MMDRRRVLWIFLLLIGLICILVGSVGFKTNGNGWFIALIVLGGICLVLVIWMVFVENIKKR